MAPVNDAVFVSVGQDGKRRRVLHNRRLVDKKKKKKKKMEKRSKLEQGCARYSSNGGIIRSLMFNRGIM